MKVGSWFGVGPAHVHTLETLRIIGIVGGRYSYPFIERRTAITMRDFLTQLRVDGRVSDTRCALLGVNNRQHVIYEGGEKNSKAMLSGSRNDTPEP